MTLTQEETDVTKLMVAKTKAQTKLNKVNLDMGIAIRAEFKIIDTAIRTQNESIFRPLEAEIKSIDDDIKALLE